MNLIKLRYIHTLTIIFFSRREIDDKLYYYLFCLSPRANDLCGELINRISEQTDTVKSSDKKYLVGLSFKPGMFRHSNQLSHKLARL